MRSAAPQAPAASGRSTGIVARSGIAAFLATLFLWSPADGARMIFGEGTLSTAVNTPSSIDVVDLDGDGDLDILTTSSGVARVRWLESNGDSSRPALTSHDIGFSGCSPSVIPVDLDGDGDLDLLTPAPCDRMVLWFENTGSDPLSFSFHSLARNVDRPCSAIPADLDGDGDQDVISVAYGEPGITWYENDGGMSPGFAPHTIDASSPIACGATAADLDADGNLDIVATTASGYEEALFWYRSDGAVPPGFDDRITIAELANRSSVMVVDLDQDGDVDLVAGSGEDGSIVWLEHDGGTPPLFTSHDVTADPDGPLGPMVGLAYLLNSLSAADLDGDGDLDFLSSTGLDRIVWYDNDGASSFVPRRVRTKADGLVSVVAADVNGDGRKDLVSASNRDERIAWYPSLVILPHDMGGQPLPPPLVIIDDPGDE